MTTSVPPGQGQGRDLTMDMGAASPVLATSVKQPASCEQAGMVYFAEGPQCGAGMGENRVQRQVEWWWQ
jgi:hypothetical protein